MSKGMFTRGVVIIIIGYSVAAYADTGWSPAYIGSVAHGECENYDYGAAVKEHPSIVMVEEEVDVYLHAAEITVRAEFSFINDGPATTVDMFYPLRWGYKSTHAIDFAVYEQSDEGSLKPILFTEENPWEGCSIARWDLPFKAGEAKEIVCVYLASYGGEAGSGFVRWQMDDYDCWEKVRNGYTYEHVLQGGEFDYTVTTGAGWKGPIGKGRIVFHTTEEVSWEDLIDSDGKLFGGGVFENEYDMEYIKQNDISISIESTSLVFSFEDLEPAQEILVYGFMYAAIDRVGVSGKEASSTLPGDGTYSYDVKNMSGFESLFSELQSGFHAWSEGVPGDGIGEWVKLDVHPVGPAEAHGEPLLVKGIRFYGGFHSDPDNVSTDLFYKNGAPSAITVEVFDSGARTAERSFDLAAFSEVQDGSFNIGSVYLPFEEPVKCDQITITIDKVRSGSEWADTCISNVVPVIHDPRTHHCASTVLVETLTDVCRYHPIKIDDGNLNTCWVEGADGDGIGEWAELKWESSHNLSNVFISSGFAGDETLFRENNRPKRLKMELFSQSGELLDTSHLDLKDAKDVQAFPVGDSGLDGVKRIRFTIEDVYPGAKYDDTCIAEIGLK